MKKTLATTALLLALLLTASIFVSCAKNGENTSSTTAAAIESAGETADPNYDSNGYLKDSLPSDLNFDSAEIGVLCWNSEKQEFEAESTTGDIVNDAIFARNTAVEERLNIKLKFTETPGDSGHIAEFVQFFAKSYNAGSAEYDIIAAQSRTAGSLAISNYLYNLNSVDYIDYEKPWWPQSVLNRMTIGDKLYFISGDASTNLLHIMYCIYYNRTMVADRGLTDPTEYVLNGTWTIDKLLEMTEGMYADLNNDGKKDKEDQYGFCTIYFHNDAFYTGSGLRLVDCDSDGHMTISDDYASEKTVSLVDKIGQWELNYNFCDSMYEYPFVNEHALFCQNRVYMAENTLREVDFSYGILPTPK